MMAARHSYVEFYSSDWIAGTAFMPPLMEWVYLQICIYNWDKAEPMPMAEAGLRLARHPDWKADLERLIDAGKVHQTRGDKIFVERAMAAAKKSLNLWEKRSRGGKLSKINADNQSDAEHSFNRERSNQNQNQNQNQISPKGDNSAGEISGDLVFSVPSDAWAEWKGHRKAAGKPLTPHAERLGIKALEKLFNAGHDPTAVIEQSIERGWTGLFELKGNSRNGNAGSRNGFLDAIADEERRDRFG